MTGAPPNTAPEGANRRPGVAGESAEAAQTNALALISATLGIFWLFGFGSAFAIYLGFKALRQIRDSEGREHGTAFAWVGIIAGVFGLSSVGLVIAVALSA